MRVWHYAAVIEKHFMKYSETLGTVIHYLRDDGDDLTGDNNRLYKSRTDRVSNSCHVSTLKKTKQRTEFGKTINCIE